MIVDEEEISKLNYGEVTFIVKNSVPVGLKFNAVVLDSAFNQVLSIPNASQNESEFMEVPNPEVTCNW